MCVWVLVSVGGRGRVHVCVCVGVCERVEVEDGKCL